MLKISFLIPCYNEEKTIAKAIDSCLNQTRPADEIVVVNDGSTDNSLAILQTFKDKIKIVNRTVNTGSKSHAQEAGIPYVTGDILITADADTLFDSKFVEAIEKEFQNAKTMAVAGHVESLKGNILTACRQIEYFYGQNVYKKAQDEVDAIYVIPGCASAFRKKVFNALVTFSHDTITEDLDFTYQFHELGVKIKYCKDAIVYTQDPDNFKSYINQVRRWSAGGVQNLAKHWKNVKKKALVFEILIMYIELLLLGAAILISPFINIYYFLYYIAISAIFSTIMGAYAAYKTRRWDLLFAGVFYVFITLINLYIFFEQAIKHFILRKKITFWFKPDRRAII